MPLLCMSLICSFYKFLFLFLHLWCVASCPQNKLQTLRANKVFSPSTSPPRIYKHSSWNILRKWKPFLCVQTNLSSTELPNSITHTHTNTNNNEIWNSSYTKSILTLDTRFKFWLFQLVNSVTLGKQLNLSSVSFSKRRKIMSNTYSENLFKNFEQCSVHSKQNTCPLYYSLPPVYFSLKIMPFTSSTTWHDLALA